MEGATIDGGAHTPPGRSPACAGKKVQRNRKDAARAATELRKRIYDRTGVLEPIKAYHCECGDWHVGHPVGWRKENNLPRPAFRIAL